MTEKEAELIDAAVSVAGSEERELNACRGRRVTAWIGSAGGDSAGRCC